MNPLRLVLPRGLSTTKSTPGKLFANGEFECFTLEDIVRPAGVKVYGQTAIPPGVYKVILTHSPKFSPLYGGKPIPLLVAVPMFEGIRMHWGNKAEDTDGCILVGDAPAPDWLGQSKIAYDRLYPKLVSGSDITIDIWAAS